MYTKVLVDNFAEKELLQPLTSEFKHEHFDDNAYKRNPFILAGASRVAYANSLKRKAARKPYQSPSAMGLSSRSAAREIAKAPPFVRKDPSDDPDTGKLDKKLSTSRKNPPSLLPAIDAHKKKGINKTTPVFKAHQSPYDQPKPGSRPKSKPESNRQYILHTAGNTSFGVQGRQINRPGTLLKDNMVAQRQQRSAASG